MIAVCACIGQVIGDLRLVSTKVGLVSTDVMLSEGRLEIYLNNQWGTVCNRNFGMLEANAACRQLGFLRSRSYGTAFDLGYVKEVNSYPCQITTQECYSRDNIPC